MGLDYHEVVLYSLRGLLPLPSTVGIMELQCSADGEATVTTMD